MAATYVSPLAMTVFCSHIPLFFTGLASLAPWALENHQKSNAKRLPLHTSKRTGLPHRTVCSLAIAQIEKPWSQIIKSMNLQLNLGWYHTFGRFWEYLSHFGSWRYSRQLKQTPQPVLCPQMSSNNSQFYCKSVRTLECGPWGVPLNDTFSRRWNMMKHDESTYSLNGWSKLINLPL